MYYKYKFFRRSEVMGSGRWIQVLRGSLPLGLWAMSIAILFKVLVNETMA